jgi:hypothetical protein
MTNYEQFKMWKIFEGYYLQNKLLACAKFCFTEIGQAQRMETATKLRLATLQ